MDSGFLALLIYMSVYVLIFMYFNVCRAAAPKGTQSCRTWWKIFCYVIAWGYKLRPRD